MPRVATATGRVKTGPVRAWKDLLGWPAIGCTALTSATGAVPASTRYVEVFVVHVGGTRCVTWSIDRIVQRHACITWGVEFIRAIFFIFFLYV